MSFFALGEDAVLVEAMFFEGIYLLGIEQMMLF